MDAWRGGPLIYIPLKVNSGCTSSRHHLCLRLLNISDSIFGSLRFRIVKWFKTRIWVLCVMGTSSWRWPRGLPLSRSSLTHGHHVHAETSQEMHCTGAEAWRPCSAWCIRQQPSSHVYLIVHSRDENPLCQCLLPGLSGYPAWTPSMAGSLGSRGRPLAGYNASSIINYLPSFTTDKTGISAWFG